MAPDFLDLGAVEEVTEETSEPVSSVVLVESEVDLVVPELLGCFFGVWCGLYVPAGSKKKSKVCVNHLKNGGYHLTLGLIGLTTGAAAAAASKFASYCALELESLGPVIVSITYTE